LTWVALGGKPSLTAPPRANDPFGLRIYQTASLLLTHAREPVGRGQGSRQYGMESTGPVGRSVCPLGS
jgi:hypothetical protein